MIKGVNQCVVEIHATENEYFDKAILFVNPEKLIEEEGRLREEGKRYLSGLPGQMGRKRRKFGWILSNGIKIAVGAGIGATVAMLLIR